MAFAKVRSEWTEAEEPSGSSRGPLTKRIIKHVKA
jgi:hypothetical protein